MTRIACLVVAATLLVACGSVPRGQASSEAGLHLYAIETHGGVSSITVLNTQTHSADRTLPIGTASRDGRHVYAIASTARGTELQEVESTTGQVHRSTALKRSYQLPAATMSGLPGGLSRNGRWLVTQVFDGQASHFAVADTAALTVARQADLPGRYEFDAIDDSGARLYLVQRSATADYVIRLYDLDRSALDPSPVVDKSEASTSMQGERLSGVYSTDGEWQFSLYVRPGGNSFVHALNLRAPFAICLDLPGGGYTGDPTQLMWSLAITPDGSHLYAANGANGSVVTIATSPNPAITKTSHMGTQAARTNPFVRDVYAKEETSLTAVVSTDGRFLLLGTGRGFEWIDTQEMTVLRRSLADRTVVGLGLSPGGRTVYALGETGDVDALSMADGHTVASFHVQWRPLTLLFVAP